MRKRLATPAQSMLLAAAMTASPQPIDMQSLATGPRPARTRTRPRRWWWELPEQGDWDRLAAAEARRARRARHRRACALATERGQTLRTALLHAIAREPASLQKHLMRGWRAGWRFSPDQPLYGQSMASGGRRRR